MNKIFEKSLEQQKDGLTLQAHKSLTKIPDWIKINYPEFANLEYFVAEGGNCTPVVVIPDKIAIKLLIDKRKNKLGASNSILQNYIQLQKFGVDLRPLGLLKIKKKDPILDCSIVIASCASGDSTDESFYLATKQERIEMTRQIVSTLKAFHVSVNATISTGEVIDTAYNRALSYKKDLPTEIWAKLEEMKNNLVPKKIKNPVIVHRDIHTGNTFWDPKTKKISFIDLDRTCLGLPFYDLSTMFLMYQFPYTNLRPSLRNPNQEPLTESWAELLRLYPELVDPKFNDENKFMSAAKLCYAITISDSTLQAQKMFWKVVNSKDMYLN